jgi:hypothetical protein
MSLYIYKDRDVMSFPIPLQRISLNSDEGATWRLAEGAGTCNFSS